MSTNVGDTVILLTDKNDDLVAYPITKDIAVGDNVILCQTYDKKLAPFNVCTPEINSNVLNVLTQDKKIAAVQTCSKNSHYRYRLYVDVLIELTGWCTNEITYSFEDGCKMVEGTTNDTFNFRIYCDTLYEKKINYANNFPNLDVVSCGTIESTASGLIVRNLKFPALTMNVFQDVFYYDDGGCIDISEIPFDCTEFFSGYSYIQNSNCLFEYYRNQWWNNINVDMSSLVVGLEIQTKPIDLINPLTSNLFNYCDENTQNNYQINEYVLGDGVIDASILSSAITTNNDSLTYLEISDGLSLCAINSDDFVISLDVEIKVE